MVVYKCDACGKEIEPNENQYGMSIGLVNKLYGEATSGIGGIKRDLCGKCYDKIIYYTLRGTDENNTNKED